MRGRNERLPHVALAHKLRPLVRRSWFLSVVLLGVVLACTGSSLTLAASPPQQPAVEIAIDRSVGGIHPGETLSAIAQSYGSEQRHQHPAYRSYFDGRQEIDVVLGADHRVLTVSSRSPTLTLQGLRLENGAAFWRARLQPRGWRFTRCRGAVFADSPSGHTGISFKGKVVFAAVISPHGLTAILTPCASQSAHVASGAFGVASESTASGRRAGPIFRIVRSIGPDPIGVKLPAFVAQQARVRSTIESAWSS